MTSLFTLVSNSRSTLFPRSRLVEPAPVDVDEVVQAWPAQVSCIGGTLPGSSITRQGTCGPATYYRVQLNAARQQYPDVRNVAPRVAAALGLRAEQVVIERDRGNRDDQIDLVVVNDSNPLYGWRRRGVAAAADGWVSIGVFADARPATWQLYNAHGAVHGAVVADPCTGSTTLLRSLLAGVTDQPQVTASVIDLRGDLALAGESSARSIGAARDRLADLYSVAQNRLGNTDELTGWNPRVPVPRHDLPLHLLVIDDLRTLMRDHTCSFRLEGLLDVAAKAGIAVVTAAADASLDSFGAARVRRELARTNLAVMRTTNSDTGRLLDVRLDMTGLPSMWHTGVHTSGVGYLPRLRNAPFRAYESN